MLATSDIPGARWVGRDALRELRREETQRRLRCPVKRDRP